ncbi:MAG TPA: S8 family serine peptidase, partial [Methylomirabilota bacterium]|nr:S8 family serine peptidase [Methylomirabilota bacterium]
RAIVIAAGNDQTKGFHARKKISTREQASLLVWSAGKDGGGLLLFVRNADGTPFEGSDLMIEGGSTADGKPLDLTKRWMGATPVANDHVTVLPVPGGASRLFLWNKAGKEAYVDAYVVGENATFVLLYQSPANTVSEPAMARQAITVGSYDWNDQFHFRGEPLTLSPVCGGLMHIGELSCYSSLGPGRDPDTLKPDIAAPGEWYSSSAAKTPDGKSIMAPENGWVPDSSGNYILFNGTSSAAPYTSGIVALMLQKRPGLTVGEVRTLLHKYATQDAFTGAVPNANWGYGKLDMAAVQAILSHL